ncbi:MAG: hypothetical protein U1F52_07440 [Burkholderiales bacterium]
MNTTVAVPAWIDGPRRWCGGLIASLGGGAAVLLVVLTCLAFSPDPAPAPDDGFCTQAVSERQIARATVRLGITGTPDGVATTLASVVPGRRGCVGSAIDALFQASVTDREWFMPFYLLTFVAVAAWLAATAAGVPVRRRAPVLAASVAIVVLAAMLFHRDRQENDALDGVLRGEAAQLADAHHPGASPEAVRALRVVSVAKWRLVAALLAAMGLAFSLIGGGWRGCAVLLFVASLAIGWGSSRDIASVDLAVRAIAVGFVLMFCTLVLFAVLWFRERRARRRGPTL